MPDFDDAPFVSRAFLTMDVGDDLDGVRTRWEEVDTTWVVVTDRGASDDVFVLDRERLAEALEGTELLVTGGDLVRRFAAPPAVVVELTHGLVELETVSGPELELARPLVVLVDQHVQLLVDARRATSPISELQVGLVHPAGVEVAAVTAAGRELLWSGPGAGGAGGQREQAEAASAADAAERVSGLQITAPGMVTHGAEVVVSASLVRPADGAPDLSFSAEPDARVSIVVTALTGMEVIDPPTATITVSAAGDEAPAEVRVRITGRREATAVVDVVRDQTHVGTVHLAMTVLVGPGFNLGPTTRAPVVQLLPGAAPDSDLAIHVIEPEPEAPGPGLLRYVAIRRGQPPVPFASMPVPQDPQQYLSSVYEGINQALEKPAPGEPPRTWAAKQELLGIGRQLNAVLLPPELNDFLAEHVADVRSLVVHTSSMLVPWELCLLTTRDAAGRTSELGYLCELFELTRWWPRTPAVETLPMQAIGVIAPGDSGLPSRQAEVDMLTALAGPGRTVTSVTATLDSVVETLSSGSYDVLHFIGHGALPDPAEAASAELVLAGSKSLKAKWIGAATANFGVAKPLVFLNACRAGNSTAGLVGPAGFARAVLEAGSAAFVGPHWDVVDTRAHEFSSRLYEELVKGEPIGRAARTARLAIKDDDDPTWLAYTVYASPSAST